MVEKSPGTLRHHIEVSSVLMVGSKEEAGSVMRKTTKTVMAVVLAHLMAGGHAAAQNREHLQLMADIRMLQEQTQQLAITLVTLNETLGTLGSALKTINGRIDDTANLMRKSFADQKLIVDNMGGDLRVIRERVDDTNVRLSALSQEVDALRTSIPVIPPTPFPPPDPVDPNDPNAALAVPVPVPPVPPSTAGLSPTRMYETAFADYASGQWTLAVAGFDAFLKAFPRSEMADDAQFYMGETHYAQNRFADAIGAYNQVVEMYPGSNSSPLAYYKRGLAQQRIGDAEAARTSWEQAVAKFPESDAGRLAKQALDRLGQTPGTAVPR
jgi:tol-pal system protein YbgF